MAQALGRQGHHVTLILLGVGETVVPAQDWENVEFHFLNLRQICDTRIDLPPEIEQAMGGRESAAYQVLADGNWNLTPPGNEESLQRIVDRVAPILKRNEVEVVEVDDFLYALGLRLREAIQKPFAVFMSSYHYWTRYFMKRTLLCYPLLGREIVEPDEWFDDFADKIGQYDGCWTCSKTAAQHLQRELGVAEDRIGLSYCGIWLDEFQSIDDSFQPFPDTGNQRILFAGRMDPAKGAHNLITALPWVLEAYPDTQVHIVGGGEDTFNYREVLWVMATQLDCEDNVTFWGHVPRNRLKYYLSQCDVFASTHTIISEPGSIMPILAMACGRAQVASEADIHPEVVTPETGVLYHPYDTRALADGLIYLLEDEERRMQMGRNARQLVEREFPWEKRAREMVHLCEQMGSTA